MPIDAKLFLETVPLQPGVYQMLNEKHEIIYVGKAKKLKNRLTSYFRSTISGKTRVMMSHADSIKFIVTQTETEALILENTLIKRHKPRYNVLFRDDKSYPYIYLSAHAKYPRLDSFRGKKKAKGRYFGPYPNGTAVRQFLHLTQKLFKLRQCRDSFFKNRSRPCLQYQIKRCSAPCVGYISEQDYAQDMQYAVLFLEGKDQVIIDELVSRMEHASEMKDYEAAAFYRDQIAALRDIHQQQHIENNGGEVDVVVLMRDHNVGIQIFMVRQGKVLGSQNYFPKLVEDCADDEILSAFIQQHYFSLEPDLIPREIILSLKIDDSDWIATGLQDHAKHKVTIKHSVKGTNAQWLKLARKNAQLVLQQKLTSQLDYGQRLLALQQKLGLNDTINRIDCFDISHTQGEATVASCVVCTADGLQNADYRRFNIKNIQAGDDYAALHQAITRRFTRLKQESEPMPDILLIDGGKGQLTQAEKVLEELQISEVLLLGICKGTGRKAEYDKIILSNDRKEILLSDNDGSRHLLQQIRDEAHRFAITGHRKQRAKARTTSTLQDIPGIGPKKRKALLQYFGGMQALKKASVEEICKVQGINRKLSELILSSL